MTRKRVRLSPAEEAARRIVALGPQVKESAWQAAQQVLANIRAEARRGLEPHLAAITKEQVRA